MFNVDITQEEKDRLVKHFTTMLKREVNQGRAIDAEMVIDCLEALRLLESVHTTGMAGAE